MRILTRYMLRAHVGPFLFALLALTGILFVNNVSRRVDELAGRGLPLDVILEVFALSLPHILALTLPMAVLVAVLYAFAQMAGDNEVTALKASGTNLIRMIMPLVVVAFLFAGFMLWFNDQLLPDANNRLKSLMADVSAKKPTLNLREQVVNPIRTSNFRTNYYLRAGRIDDETQHMKDVVIYDLSAENNARTSRTVYADSGVMALNPAQTDMMLTLYDGSIVEADEQDPGEFRRVLFEKQVILQRGVGTTLERTTDSYRSDREMSIAMLRAVVDTAQRELERLQQEAQQVHQANLDRVINGPAAQEPDGARPASLGGYRPGDPPPYLSGREFDGGDAELARAALDAQRLANNVETQQLTMNRYRVEIHKKFAIPVACIIFVLIGAPLAVSFPRGGVGMVIAASLGIFAIYYMSLIGGESLGDEGRIPPFLGPWAPNMLFGVLALWALSRMGRETATSRGGGWDDMWLTLRSMFTLRRRGAR